MLRKKPTKLGSYQILDPIGKGGSSEVYEAKGPWGQKVAVKLQRTPKKRQRFLQEFDIPNMIIHPCFNSIYDYGVDRNGWSYLVMDLIEGAVSAVTYAKRFPIKKRVQVTIKIGLLIAEALGHLHKKGWIHGDIKSKNILLDKWGCVRLIDFELARHLNDTGRGNFFGTRSYAPPEQHEGKKLNTSVDIYALAGVMCRMIHGKLPFPKMEKSKQADYRRKNKPTISKAFPTAVRKLLNRCLSPEAKLRPQDGETFARELSAASGQFIPEAKKSKTMSTAQMAELLTSNKLSLSHLPHLHYFSGGNQAMAVSFVEHMSETGRWVPESHAKIWSEQLSALPLIARDSLCFLAALGGRAQTSLLAKISGCSPSDIRKNLKEHPEIVEKDGREWSLRFGAMDSLLIRHMNKEMVHENLNCHEVRRLRYGKLALLIFMGKLAEAEKELQDWIQHEADSMRQWIFLQRLLRKKRDLRREEEILILRWQGDWSGVVSLRKDIESKRLLKAIELAGQGSGFDLTEISGAARSPSLDVQIGARSLLAEWHIINGRFHDALVWLKPLSRKRDFFPRNIGLTQRALIHVHLGQYLMTHRVAELLSSWAVTDKSRKMIERLREEDWIANWFDITALQSGTPYLNARLALKNKNPDPKLFKRLTDSLSLQDRATLLCNQEWRIYEKFLRLPPPPKTR